MTVVKRAAAAASTFFERFRTIDAPQPPALPSDTLVDSLASRADVIAVPRSERRAPGIQRQRERRASRGRTDRRRADRRKADNGSPYGTERRTGADDRQADRRGSAGERHAGIGLTRDYFSQVETRPPDARGTDLPAHLLIRFNS
jgi:hypothetical protein